MPALPSSVSCSGKQGKTEELSVEEIWLCDFPLFSLLPVVTWLSCLELFNLVVFILSVSLPPSSLCLSLSVSTPCPLSSHPHLPHISVSVPGYWHNTDGPGSGKDVNLRERCLLWVFHCWEETLLVFLFALSRFIIAHWNLFFKLRKLHVSANCGSVYWSLSRCWMLCAHSQTRGLLLTLCRLLCGIWQRACCSVD